MPSPFIEYHIDFDEDKVLESAEDVAGDLKAFTLTRGKDVSANRAPAATLLTSMHNYDGKYTPPNTGSSLYPFQLPGPDVRLRMAYPYDAFAGSNSAALNGRVLPKADLQTVAEGGWDAWSGDTQYEIQSNHIERNATTGAHTACVLDFETANARIGADVVLDTGTGYPYTQPLFVFRWTDSSNYDYVYVYFADANTWGVGVAGYSGGVFDAYENDVTYNMAGGTVWDKGDAARVEVQFQDEEVIAWVNDYAVLEESGVDGNLTGTKHGIGGSTFAGCANSGVAGSRSIQWHNFGGWNTVFAGRADTVEPNPGIDAEANIASWDDFERLNRHPVFKTAEPTKTAKELIDIVLEAGDVPGDRPLLNGLTPVTDLLTIADDGETLMADFAKAMGLSALGELYQIQDDDVGFIWIDGRGTFRYEETGHRDIAPHDTHAASWGDVSGSAPSISMEPRPKWLDGKDVVENEIFYRFNRASLSLAATAWILEQDDNPDFQVAPASTIAGSWLTLEITALSDGDTMGNIKNPIPGSGYTIHENANGTGVDWLTPLASETGTVTFTETIVGGVHTVLQIDDDGAPFSGSTSVGAGSFGKDGRLITVRDASGNTAVGYCGTTDVDGDDTRRNITDWPEDYQSAGVYGSPGWLRADDDFDVTDTPLTFDTMLSAAYLVDGYEGETAVIKYLTHDGHEDSNFLTSALLVADVTSASNPTAARSADATSQATFGRRRIDHTTKYIDTWSMAQDRANKRLAVRKDERERFTVTINNLDKYNLMEIMYRDVSDRVRVSVSEMGISNRDYWIENYVMNLTQSGKFISMTYTLSKVV
jgi:hypothetical protein